MDIGIVTDEIAPGFLEAIGFGKQWGIKKYEIRTLRTGRVPNIERHELREVADALRSEDVQITALSPGLFKVPIFDRVKIRTQLRVDLPETINLAQKLGTKNIIVFGFQRRPEETAKDDGMVVDVFEEALETASRSGITLLVENEPGFWCDTGSNTSAVLAKINSPFLRANWDPCNAFGMEEAPFPDGYSAIKDFVSNVHVKDTRVGALVECVPVGEGLLDWRGQLTAIVRDGRVQHVTIETHSLPLIEKSKRNVEVVREMLSQIERTGLE